MTQIKQELAICGSTGGFRFYRNRVGHIPIPFHTNHDDSPIRSSFRTIVNRSFERIPHLLKECFFPSRKWCFIEAFFCFIMSLSFKVKIHSFTQLAMRSLIIKALVRWKGHVQRPATVKRSYTQYLFDKLKRVKWKGPKNWKERWKERNTNHIWDLTGQDFFFMRSNWLFTLKATLESSYIAI